MFPSAPGADERRGTARGTTLDFKLDPKDAGAYAILAET